MYCNDLRYFFLTVLSVRYAELLPVDESKEVDPNNDGCVGGALNMLLGADDVLKELVNEVCGCCCAVDCCENDCDCMDEN